MPRPHSKGVNQNLPASASTLLGARVGVGTGPGRSGPSPSPDRQSLLVPQGETPGPPLADGDGAGPCGCKEASGKIRPHRGPMSPPRILSLRQSK